MIGRIKAKLHNIFQSKKRVGRQSQRAKADRLTLDQGVAPDRYAQVQRTRPATEQRASPVVPPLAKKPSEDKPAPPSTPRGRALVLITSPSSQAREQGLNLLDSTEPNAKFVDTLMHSPHANVRDYAVRKYVALLGIDGACGRLMVHIQREDEPVIRQFAIDQSMELIRSFSVDRREQGLRLLDKARPDAHLLEELTRSPYGIVRGYAIENYVRVVGLGAARERLVQMRDDGEPRVRALVRDCLIRLSHF